MMISPSIRPLEQETKPHNHKSQYLGTIKVFLRTGFFRAYFLIFAINLRTLSLQPTIQPPLMTLAYILFTTITVVCLLSNQLLIESILSILAAMICKKSRGNTETVLCHLHRLTISTMILHKSSANPWTHGWCSRTAEPMMMMWMVIMISVTRRFSKPLPGYDVVHCMFFLPLLFHHIVCVCCL